LYFLFISCVHRVRNKAEKGRNVPDGGGDSGDSVLLGNLGLIDGDFREFTWLLVEFDRLGADGQCRVNIGRKGTYTTESISTSPPKYRDKSQKWVPCSMTGPISIDLFHHAGLAIAS
jgi:hypothetical protein